MHGDELNGVSSSIKFDSPFLSGWGCKTHAGYSVFCLFFDIELPDAPQVLIFIYLQVASTAFIVFVLFLLTWVYVCVGVVTSNHPLFFHVFFSNVA